MGQVFNLPTSNAVAMKSRVAMGFVELEFVEQGGQWQVENLPHGGTIQSRLTIHQKLVINRPQMTAILQQDGAQVRRSVGLQTVESERWHCLAGSIPAFPGELQ